MEVKNFIRKAFDAIIHASEILDEHSLTALSSKVASRSEMLRKKLGDPTKGTKSDGESASRLASPRALANAVYYSPKEGSLPVLPRSLSPRPNLHTRGHIMAIRAFWKYSLTFYTDNLLLDNIDRVRNDFVTIFEPVEFAHFKLPSMGNVFLHSHRMPSKPGIQVVIQLASLLYYGVQRPSWETLRMMLFRSGRLD